MPCFRCGARQTDPVRGDSPWRRGVLADRQVLVCPTCQGVPDSGAALDGCVDCGSVALVCRLGEVECRDCGHTRAAAPTGAAPTGDQGATDTSADTDLSAQVEAALGRRFQGRPAR
jgi:hypothetical protein